MLAQQLDRGESRGGIPAKSLYFKGDNEVGQVSGWRLAGMLLGLAALPAAAHHSFAAKYGQDKPIKLTGTVTKFDVTNLHSWIYIDVKNADRKVVNRGFETASVELDPTGHCHYEGIPHAMYFSFQIVETPPFIAVLHENRHAWRLIYIDRSHHAKDYSAWMGDSRGDW